MHGVDAAQKPLKKHANRFVMMMMIRYDTIESLTWTRKLSIQLNLTHVARN